MTILFIVDYLFFKDTLAQGSTASRSDRQHLTEDALGGLGHRGFQESRGGKPHHFHFSSHLIGDVKEKSQFGALSLTSP